MIELNKFIYKFNDMPDDFVNNGLQKGNEFYLKISTYNQYEK